MKLDHTRIGTAVSALHFALTSTSDHSAITHSCALTTRGSSRRTVCLDTDGNSAAPAKDPAWTDAVRTADAELQAATEIRPVAMELTIERDGSWRVFASDAIATEIDRQPIRFDHTSLELPPMSDAARVELATSWEAGRDDFCAEPPATDEDISELSAALQIPVPPELAALLHIVNGAEIDDPEDWDATVTGGWSLLSAANIATHHARIAEDAAYGPNSGSVTAFDGVRRTQPRTLHPGWIPFASDDNGNYLGIDTAPGPEGRPGQIVEFGADYPDGAVVRANALTDYFADRRLPAPQGGQLYFRLGPGDPIPPEAQGVSLLQVPEVTAALFGGVANLRRLSATDAASVDITGLDQLIELSVTRVDRLTLGDHAGVRKLSLADVDAVEGRLVDLPALEEISLNSLPDVSLIDELATHPRLHGISVGDLPLRDRVHVHDRFAESPARTIELHG